jgi:hypothetical protein
VPSSPTRVYKGEGFLLRINSPPISFTTIIPPAPSHNNLNRLTFSAKCTLHSLPSLQQWLLLTLREHCQLLHRLSSQTLALFLLVPNVPVPNSVLEALNALPATLCRLPLAASTTQHVTTTLNAPPIFVPVASAVGLCLNQSG